MNKSKNEQIIMNKKLNKLVEGQTRCLIGLKLCAPHAQTFRFLLQK